jgi:H+/gluconate symporter-like permease
MSRTIALLVAAVLGGACNGLELPTSPASVNEGFQGTHHDS